jgi:carboxyl-terminal processing protease
MIERHHYAPRLVNDSFSSDVFHAVIQSLHQYYTMFTAVEYQQLTAHRYTIDDELNGRSWNFLHTLVPIYAQAIKRGDSILANLLEKPLDFSVDEKGTWSRTPILAFPATAAEMRQAYNRRLKWQMLHLFYEQTLSSEVKVPLQAKLIEQEKTVRQKLKRSLLAETQHLRTPEAIADHVKEAYLVAVARAYDPHTAYFSPAEKESFQSALSSENKSFGFLIEEKEGKVIIHQLVPGGAAWRSGELHRNDQVLQFQIDGREPVDVSLFSADELSEMLESSSAQRLTIRIKKSDGNIKTLQLNKQKVDTEENIVKGFVLKGAKNMGYISLPDFYTSWDEESGSSCADDVAREIVKLKKEKIDGLILDVRYNGGGSMDEALQLIGIFINEGPLMGIKRKDAKLQFLKDPNRGTIYDGPLVVLINGQSASASEALASTLQDCQRAVIVGSTSFGKATMQQILPLDTTAGDRMVPSPLGYLKVTTGKLYRLTGNTAQLKGVQPDVLLPDAYDILDSREQSLPQALPADTVKRNEYYKPLPALPIATLAQLSEQRVKASAGFSTILQSMQQLSNQMRSPTQTVPLRADAFEKWRRQYDSAMEMNTGKGTSHAHFAVANHQYDMQRLQSNTYANEMNTLFIKRLQEDLYLEEAFRILTDLIQYTSIK